MKNHFIASFLGLLPFLAGSYCYAEGIPIDSERWEFVEVIPGTEVEHKIEKHLGQQSLYLRLGFAVIKDIEATDGIIEYDVAFDQQPGDGNSGYLGIVWHYQDDQNYEHFYMRPHQSGDTKATQYTPVIHGSNNEVWYREFSNAYRYSFDKWTPVKVILSGGYTEIYIEDMDNPVMSFPQQLDAKSGRIGLMSNGIKNVPILKGGYFANFKFTEVENPPLKNPPKPPVISVGAIKSWAISDVIEDQSLKGKLNLTEDDRQIGWTELAADTLGLANFFKLQNLKQENNKRTVFARTTIISDKDQIKSLNFLYNIRNTLRVYFNGRLLFVSPEQGDDRIDNFKEVYLPLERGENELWMAFTKAVTPGGWGVKAHFDDLDGIELTTASSED